MCQSLMFWHNSKGYTLLESLFQLVILSIFAQLFIAFVLWKGSMEDQYTSPALLEWELFSLELQELLTNVQAISVSASGTSLRIEKQDEVHVVEQYHSLIRRTKREGGHVPMLTHIRLVTFQKKEHFINMSVTLQDGKKLDKDFVVHEQME